MPRVFQIVACLYLGLMSLWWADLLFNNGIPPPRGKLLYLYQAVLSWLVVILYARSK